MVGDFSLLTLTVAVDWQTGLQEMGGFLLLGLLSRKEMSLNEQAGLSLG